MLIHPQVLARRAPRRTGQGREKAWVIENIFIHTPPEERGEGHLTQQLITIKAHAHLYHGYNKPPSNYLSEKETPEEFCKPHACMAKRKAERKKLECAMFFNGQAANKGRTATRRVKSALEACAFTGTSITSPSN